MLRPCVVPYQNWALEYTRNKTNQQMMSAATKLACFWRQTFAVKRLQTRNRLAVSSDVENMHMPAWIRHILLFWGFVTECTNALPTAGCAHYVPELHRTQVLSTIQNGRENGEKMQYYTTPPVLSI